MFSTTSTSTNWVAVAVAVGDGNPTDQSRRLVADTPASLPNLDADNPDVRQAITSSRFSNAERNVYFMGRRVTRRELRGKRGWPGAYAVGALRARPPAGVEVAYVEGFVGRNRGTLLGIVRGAFDPT